ncbi:MAG: DUF423 domain-containing protein [Pirellulales bacterium]
MSRTTILLGILFGLLGVGIGAFGAHGLKDTLAATGRAANFETGAQYQMYHALALIGLGLWQARSERVARAKIATWCFAAGILLFSGSLYVLAVTGVTTWGAVTPFGGSFLIAGWAVWGYAVLREPS